MSPDNIRFHMDRQGFPFEGGFLHQLEVDWELHEFSSIAAAANVIHWTNKNEPRSPKLTAKQWLYVVDVLMRAHTFMLSKGGFQFRHNVPPALQLILDFPMQYLGQIALLGWSFKTPFISEEMIKGQMFLTFGPQPIQRNGQPTYASKKMIDSNEPFCLRDLIGRGKDGAELGWLAKVEPYIERSQSPVPRFKAVLPTVPDDLQEKHVGQLIDKVLEVVFALFASQVQAIQDVEEYNFRHRLNYEPQRSWTFRSTLPQLVYIHDYLCQISQGVCSPEELLPNDFYGRVVTIAKETYATWS